WTSPRIRRDPGGAPTPRRSRWRSPPAATRPPRARRSPSWRILRCDFFGDAQHRRTCAWIARDFRVVGLLRAPDGAKRRARRRGLRQAAAHGHRLRSTDELLDDAIFERVETDH